MLCDVVRRRRRWAHAPVIHAASHFDHKKRVAWVPISMIRVVPFSIIMGLRLAALRAAGAPLKIPQSFTFFCLGRLGVSSSQFLPEKVRVLPKIKIGVLA